MNLNLYLSTEIIAQTPISHDHSAGFHDIRPFNKINNNLILLHRYPLNTLGFKINSEREHKVDICLWDINKTSIEKIDETDLWSWEQGSRLQWLNSTTLIYNKSKNQKDSSIIYDFLNKKKTDLETSIYSINKGGLILSINYARLWKYWKSYGYKNLSNLDLNIHRKKPENDGIFLSDLNGSKQLFLSIEKAVEICGLKNLDKEFFLCHPTFNPAGNKFISLLRYFNDSGALISYLISTDIEKNTNTIIAREKVSHFEWISENEIIVWCRNLNNKITNLRNNSFLEKNVFPVIKKFLSFSKASFKNKILSNYYYIINVDNPSNPKKITNKLLNEDGHPQISPNKRFLITDTYADKNGYLKLFLLDLKTDQVYKIGQFKIADYLVKNKLKYDLHPRWDNSGKLINFDSSHLGSRQNFVIDITKLLSEIG